VPGKAADSGEGVSFHFIPEMKFNSVVGHFGLSSGARFGVTLDQTIFIGLGGYGMVSPTAAQMGYGGIAVEYLPWSDRKTHVSFGCLIGGGGYWVESFFVAEPEVRLNIKIRRWFHIGIGAGYRFTGGHNSVTKAFGGPFASISFGFGT
jgi:hypothetical protein